MWGQDGRVKPEPLTSTQATRQPVPGMIRPPPMLSPWSRLVHTRRHPGISRRHVAAYWRV